MSETNRFPDDNKAARRCQWYGVRECGSQCPPRAVCSKQPLGYDSNRAKREDAWWGGFQAGIATGVLIGAMVVSVVMVCALSRDVIVMPPKDSASRCVLECQEEIEP